MDAPTGDEILARAREMELPFFLNYPTNGMKTLDMVDGETIPRRFGPNYEMHKQQRQARVDFDSVDPLRSALIEYVRLSGEEPLQVMLALRHLDDAQNLDLDLDIRETHYDCAGGLVYEVARSADTIARRRLLGRYFTLYTNAGGI